MELVPLTLADADLIEPIFWTLAPTEGAALHTEKLRATPDALSEETRRILHFAHAVPAVLAVTGPVRTKTADGRYRGGLSQDEDRCDGGARNHGARDTRRRSRVSFERQDGQRELALWSYGTRLSG